MALNVWIILSVQQMLTCWCTGRSISEEIKVRIWIYTICIFLIIALFCRRLTVISLSILHYWSKKCSLSPLPNLALTSPTWCFLVKSVIIFNKVSYYLKAISEKSKSGSYFISPWRDPIWLILIKRSCGYII